ncbi:MAG: hypothetical protein JW956_14135 [Calditrichaceae bacterium]|nr:hypothetical protein [Calditrichaceae bacterium]
MKKKVSNPLTIIAIFAALSEVAATISIGFLQVDLQKIFIWYIIFFPVLLVILFFLILFFKSEVLYAPSDFRSDETYLSIYNRLKFSTYAAIKSESENNNDLLDENNLKIII